MKYVIIWNKNYWFVFVIVSQRHLNNMAETQTMQYEKLYKKGKEVTFEPDFYYSQVNIGTGGPISSASVHTSHFC